MKELSQTHVRLGRRIRQYREQRGLSQEDLAFKLGITTSYMGALERGQRNLNIDKLIKVAKALKIDLGDLFKGLPA
jgi:transcriptional regulator with XRE-family HTH domain